MVPKETSRSGDKFIIDREGCPTRAYRDVGGVITIGPGFTMLSRVFADYWRKTRGHALQMGDVLPKTEALKIFHQILNAEFVPPVVQNIAPKEQHHLDGASSVSYNAGTGSTKWKWAKALKAGNILECVQRLAVTAVTAGGRPVRGLRIRRAAECRLIKDGDYGSAITSTEGGVRSSSVSNSAAEVLVYQKQLKALGYFSGELDGRRGPLTSGAVKNFQTAKGLKVDGIVGPATRAALARAIADKNQNRTTVGAGPAAAGGSGFTLQIDNIFTLVLIAGGVMLGLVIVFAIWNNRGVILRKRTPV